MTSALTIFCLVLLALTSNAKAAPGNVIITIKIPAAKVQIASAQFLRERPIPMISDDTDPNNIIMVPQYTTKQWVKRELIAYFLRECRAGKQKLKMDSAEDDGVLME